MGKRSAILEMYAADENPSIEITHDDATNLSYLSCASQEAHSREDLFLLMTIGSRTTLNLIGMVKTSTYLS
ncbi:hypothetical protein CTI12_AA371830 [Artemisia annua]|uniref:Uncharacterized protein n=1 Tax=Artemisia annua TaxID=35608 RepID=A0A2U1M579_ARTAN|nr:hypothetical protein CTI12_AA371830 [Artemisia annua]